MIRITSVLATFCFIKLGGFTKCSLPVLSYINCFSVHVLYMYNIGTCKKLDVVFKVLSLRLFYPGQSSSITSGIGQEKRLRCNPHLIFR